MILVCRNIIDFSIIDLISCKLAQLCYEFYQLLMQILLDILHRQSCCLQREIILLLPFLSGWLLFLFLALLLESGQNLQYNVEMVRTAILAFSLISGKAFSLCALSKMIALGLLQMPFINLGQFSSLPSLLQVFLFVCWLIIRYLCLLLFTDQSGKKFTNFIFLKYFY